MIEEADKREDDLKEKLVELKKKNITKSTLRSTRHVIWEKIQRVVAQEWPHLVLANEEADLVIMVNQEVERITREINDNPFKCQQLIRLLKSKSIHELLYQGVRDRTTMIMQGNLVVAKYRLMEAAKY